MHPMKVNEMLSMNPVYNSSREKEASYHHNWIVVRIRARALQMVVID